MKNQITANNSKQGKTLLLCCLSILLFGSCISSYIGYNGYKKWKPRRSTFGNRKEAVERNIFVKDLDYTSNLKLDSFHVYIEKGFKYGHQGDYQTVLLENDKYPYQVCYHLFIDKSNIYRYDNNMFKENTDTLSSVYFLEEPKLKAPFTVKISKLVEQKWDSIGYLKVWDTNMDK